MPLIIFRLLVTLALLLVPLASAAQEIAGPDVKFNDGHIVVSTTLKLSDNQLKDISKGISKEMDIYVDLFRVWKSWPDEFVMGTKFTRTLKCDSVKKEFVATSLAGDTLREKRFSDCESLLKWALTIEGHKLANMAQLEPASYFVKVTAESRLRKLPPVVGYLFFFVKDQEFKIFKNSKPFEVTGGSTEEQR